MSSGDAKTAAKTAMDAIWLAAKELTVQRVAVPVPAQGEALMALGPSTLAQLPASGRKDLDSIARLVRSVPCFRMNLGTDLSRIAPAISGLLNQLNHRTG